MRGIVRSQDAGVVTAAQSAIAGEDQHASRFGMVALLQQRMLDLGSGCSQAVDDLRQPIGVGSHGRGAIHRLLVTRRGNQFHRPRDLADVANRLSTFIECAGVGHESINALRFG